MMWRRSPDALWRAAPGFLVLGDREGNTIDVTGPGEAIWRLLGDGIDEDSLVDQLAATFSADIEQVRVDALRLLNDLWEAGYVQRTS